MRLAMDVSDIFPHTKTFLSSYRVNLGILFPLHFLQLVPEKSIPIFDAEYQCTRDIWSNQEILSPLARQF